MEKQITYIHLQTIKVVYDKFTFILERIGDGNLNITVDFYLFNNEEFRLSDRDNLDIESFYNEFLPYYNDVITIDKGLLTNNIRLDVGVVGIGRKCVNYNFYYYIEERILRNKNVIRNDNLFKNGYFYLQFKDETEINLK